MGDFWCFDHFATDEMHHTKNVWYWGTKSLKKSVKFHRLLQFSVYPFHADHIHCGYQIIASVCGLDSRFATILVNLPQTRLLLELPSISRSNISYFHQFK